MTQKHQGSFLFLKENILFEHLLELPQLKGNSNEYLSPLCFAEK